MEVYYFYRLPRWKEDTTFFYFLTQDVMPFFIKFFHWAGEVGVKGWFSDEQVEIIVKDVGSLLIRSRRTKKKTHYGNTYYLDWHPEREGSFRKYAYV